MSTYEWECTGQEGQTSILRFFQRRSRTQRRLTVSAKSLSTALRMVTPSFGFPAADLFLSTGGVASCSALTGIDFGVSISEVVCCDLRIDRVGFIEPSAKPVAVVVRQLYKCSVVGHKTKQDECTLEQDTGGSQGCSQTSSPDLLTRAQILQQRSQDRDCVLA